MATRSPVAEVDGVADALDLGMVREEEARRHAGVALDVVPDRARERDELGEVGEAAADEHDAAGGAEGAEEHRAALVVRGGAERRAVHQRGLDPAARGRTRARREAREETAREALARDRAEKRPRSARGSAAKDAADAAIRAARAEARARAYDASGGPVGDVVASARASAERVRLRGADADLYDGEAIVSGRSTRSAA